MPKSRLLLADVEGGRANNLNLIRLVFASSVILSHSFDLLNQRKQEVLARYIHFGANMGDVAVFGFFFVSGFLILKSAIRKSDAGLFFKARVLRIFPALVVVVLLSIFVLGPAVTTLPVKQYFSSSTTWRYLAGIPLSHWFKDGLPGVFTDAHIAEVNLPLWTLPLEWFMYVSAFVAVICYEKVKGVVSMSKRSWLFLGIALVFTAQTFPLALKYGYKAMLCFVAGSAAYLLRRNIQLQVVAAIAGFAVDLALIRFVPPLGKVLFMPSFFYFILVVGFHPALLVGWFKRFGDYSYGIYIYAWPVQEVVLAHTHTTSAYKLAAVSFGITLPLAVASWELVERKDAWWRRRWSAVGKRETPLPRVIA